MNSKQKRAQQAAKSAHAHRHELNDPYWEAVWQILAGRKFNLGGISFEQWRKRMVDDKLTPDQVLDYAWHYGTQMFWKDLALAGVKDLTGWIVACGLPDNQQFHGWDDVRAKPYIDDIIRWHKDGYTSSQVRAWRSVGLAPEDVEDKNKVVVIIHPPVE